MAATWVCGLSQAMADPSTGSRPATALSGVHRQPVAPSCQANLPHYPSTPFPQLQAPWRATGSQHAPPHDRMPHAHRVVAGNGAAVEAHGQAAAVNGLSIGHATMPLGGTKGGVAATWGLRAGTGYGEPSEGISHLARR